MLSLTDHRHVQNSLHLKFYISLKTKRKFQIISHSLTLYISLYLFHSLSNSFKLSMYVNVTIIVRIMAFTLRILYDYDSTIWILLILKNLFVLSLSLLFPTFSLSLSSLVLSLSLSLFISFSFSLSVCLCFQFDFNQRNRIPNTFSFDLRSLSQYYEFSKDQDYICSTPEDSGMHLCGNFPPYRIGSLICTGEYERKGLPPALLSSIPSSQAPTPFSLPDLNSNWNFVHFSSSNEVQTGRVNQILMALLIAFATCLESSLVGKLRFPTSRHFEKL